MLFVQYSFHTWSFCVELFFPRLFLFVNINTVFYCLHHSVRMSLWIVRNVLYICFFFVSKKFTATEPSLRLHNFISCMSIITGLFCKMYWTIFFLQNRGRQYGLRNISVRHIFKGWKNDLTEAKCKYRIYREKNVSRCELSYLYMPTEVRPAHFFYCACTCLSSTYP